MQGYLFLTRPRVHVPSGRCLQHQREGSDMPWIEAKQPHVQSVRLSSQHDAGWPTTQFDPLGDSYKGDAVPWRHRSTGSSPCLRCSTRQLMKPGYVRVPALRPSVKLPPPIPKVKAPSPLSPSPLPPLPSLHLPSSPSSSPHTHTLLPLPPSPPLSSPAPPPTPIPPRPAPPRPPPSSLSPHAHTPPTHLPPTHPLCIWQPLFGVSVA